MALTNQLLQCIVEVFTLLSQGGSRSFYGLVLVLAPEAKMNPLGLLRMCEHSFGAIAKTACTVASYRESFLYLTYYPVSGSI